MRFRPPTPRSWQPEVLTSDGAFGVQAHQFGFTVRWAPGKAVVVEATTNLTNPKWFVVGTNNLTAGSSFVSDPQPAAGPSRFYRVRSP